MFLSELYCFHHLCNSAWQLNTLKLIQLIYFAAKKNEDTVSLSDKHKAIEEMELKPRKCLDSMQ